MLTYKSQKCISYKSQLWIKQILKLTKFQIVNANEIIIYHNKYEI